MSATDELRRMLDERGVEWEDMSIRPYACTSWRDPDGEPCTALEGADDIPDGRLSAQALLTPAQAIDATLGRGTCRNISPKLGNDEFTCEECCARVYGSCGEWFDANWKYHKFNYCPNCGRRVVEQ